MKGREEHLFDPRRDAENTKGVLDFYVRSCAADLSLMRSFVSGERQRRQSSSSHRKVLLYLKGRKRRLERLQCGKIFAFCQDSQVLARFGHSGPRHGALAGNCAMPARI